MEEHDIRFVGGDEGKGVVRGRVVGEIIGSDSREAQRTRIVLYVCPACVLAQAIRIGIEIHIHNKKASVVGVLLRTRRQTQERYEQTQKEAIRT